MTGFVKADICRQVRVCLHVFCGILFAHKPFRDYSLCPVCILPQPAFYSQSVVYILHSVCILPLVGSLQSAVCVLLLVWGLHFTHSLHFTPGPQSAVHSPQSTFYTDRFQLRKKWKYIRGLRLPGLSLAINTSRPHYLARRKSEATGVNNDLIDWGGTRDLSSVEYKNKKSIVLPTTPERIPGPKIKSQNSSPELLSLKNSLRHKGIPETIKLGNKNNIQDINPLLKIRSPKALITLNAQINPPLQ